MKKRLITILLSSLSFVVLSAVSVSTYADEKTKTLEQARTALKDAKSALEAAENTLEDAQRSEELLAQQANTTQKPAKLQSKLYKWVDDKGGVSYQDTPPPKNVKILDSDVLKEQTASGQPVSELKRSSDPEPLLDGSQPVMVYTADNCKPCQSVVLFLTQKQVPFIERDIRSDRRARERLSNLSKQISVPSLFIGERVIQGHSKPMITRALEEAGYLKPQ